MFGIKKKSKSQSTLIPMNIIGIKSNKEYRMPMIFFSTIMTLITLYCIVKIELDSFKIWGDFQPGIYGINKSEIKNLNFTNDEIINLFIILLIGCTLICIVNGLKKHLIKSTAVTVLAYVVYFGCHYKYVANGFVHALNKTVYTIITQRGESSDMYYVPYFDMVDIKLEMKYFIMTVVFGTCFLLAYSAVNHCNPVLFTTCVSVYISVPFICNTFVGEEYLVCAGVACILMFIIHIQGYSNFASKKIFAGLGNSIKIRGRYVSFSSFQQAAVFLAFTIIVLVISNFICDFGDYQRSEKVDRFGRNLIYSFQNVTSTNNFGTFGNTSNGLNNGDLKNMGDLHYTGEIMFEIKATPDKNISPLYFRTFTAADYSGDQWKAIPKNTYKSYDFWDTLFSNNFYPQFCSGDFSDILLDNLNYVNISINSKNINPKIFLNEYRTVSGKTEVLNDADAEYDNEFFFDAFGGIRSYEQTAVIKEGISKDDITADVNDFDGDFYNLLHDGDFNAYDSDIYNQEYNKFKDNEKKYRKFVVENYLEYPNNMEKYLPSNFDSTIENIYSGVCYNDTFINYSYDDEEDIYYSLYEYNDEFADSYNNTIVPEYYNMVIQYIRNYIQSNAEYTLTPGATPKDRELVEYFLTENHKGYCVHFATAATLMLRRAGIPARYVEGYFVSDYDLNSKNSKGYSGIPDSNAHAWTEVYYPVIGWQVVDFTPYYSEEMLPEENKINKETDNTSDTETETDTDTQTETDTDSESDTDTDSVGDTDTSEKNKPDSDTNTDVSVGSDSDNVNITYEKDSNLKNVLKVIGSILLVILKIVIVLALIAALWFFARFIVLKIRYVRFNSPDTRKGAKAMYIHSLWILKIAGVTPEKGEGDRKFGDRAVLQIDEVKTADYQNFTDSALNARFGKNSPSEQDILQMNDFLKTLSEGVYNSSKKWKKLLMRYILFLK